jgi:Zn-dependent protease with chaperone function
MSDFDLSRLKHPREDARFKLAVLATTPLLLLGLVLIGSLLIVAMFVVPMVWLAVAVLEARYKGNLVRVSATNFPEIKEIIDDARRRLGYTPTIRAYVQHGDPNMFLYKFFSRRFLVINSDFIDAGSRAEVQWLVGRFIGSLKAKHDRLSWLAALIGVSEKLLVLNLLLYPYERAVVHTSDRLGLFLCQDLGAALSAIGRMIVGKDLRQHVSVQGLLEQQEEMRGEILPRLARLASSHPHMVDRCADLIGFAREHLPHLLVGLDVAADGRVPLFAQPTSPRPFAQAA